MIETLSIILINYYEKNILYVEINTLGNSLDFGELTETKRGHTGIASATRGFFSGGNNPSNSSIIDVVTISAKLHPKNCM